MAWNNLACVYLDEGAVQLALQHYIQAILLDPTLECAYVNMACRALVIPQCHNPSPQIPHVPLIPPHLKPDSLQAQILGSEGLALQLAQLACLLRDNDRESHAEYLFRRSLYLCETAAGHSGLGVFGELLCSM